MHKPLFWRAIFLSVCGSLAVCFTPAVNLADDAEKEPAPQIEIHGFGDGGGFGGFGFALPKGFEEMMKAAQEVQELQAKYQGTVDELVAAAKDLDHAQNLMEAITKVSKLAKQSEELKVQIAQKQEEMTKKLGGGAVGLGGFGFGGVEGGDARIFPFAPSIEIEIDGAKVATPKFGDE